MSSPHSSEQPQPSTNPQENLAAVGSSNPEHASANPSDRPAEAEERRPAPLRDRPPSPQFPGWRLWLPLAFQTALILAVPAQDAYTYATGKTVTLQTLPVDPYDLLRGYSQTLRYTISDRNTLSKLPGGDWLTQPQPQMTSLYVILEAAQTTPTTPPQPWKPIRVSRDRPQQLPPNQVALEGQFNGWEVIYGLETYYMPEDQREQINQGIREAQIAPATAPTAAPTTAPTASPRPDGAPAPNRQPFVVDVKVDAVGNSVPMSLWVRDRNYRF
jgi:uncharacterized membrane-anchored protein